jgi:hypothetical protein
MIGIIISLATQILNISSIHTTSGPLSSAKNLLTEAKFHSIDRGTPRYESQLVFTPFGIGVHYKLWPRCHYWDEWVGWFMACKIVIDVDMNYAKYRKLNIIYPILARRNIYIE